MYRGEWESLRVSDAVSSSLHGGNFVATANSVSANNPFQDVASSLSLSTLRFPGGDVTERYLSPNSETWAAWITSDEDSIRLPNGREFATLRSFIDQAAETNATVSIVLPTEGLLTRNPDGTFSVDQTAVEKVASLVHDLITGEYGAVTIRQFEIGNEYYVDGRLSAEEYGEVANELVLAIKQVFENIKADRPLELLLEPDIVVQAGPPWQTGDNQTIIDSLSEEAKGEIDGVVVHWYPRNLDNIDRLNNTFESIDAWINDPGFTDIQLHVTEWNVFNSPRADTGMFQASTLLEGYEKLVVEEVASADVWGVAFPRLLTRLAAPVAEDNPIEEEDQGYRLTPAGEIIRSVFSSTEGLYALKVQLGLVVTNAEDAGEEGTDYTISSFGDESRAVIYVGARGDHLLDLNIDTENYFAEAHHIIIQKFETHDDTNTAVDESDPDTAPYVAVTTQTFTREEFENLVVSLKPGEIAKIEFVIGNEGFRAEGQTGAPVNGINYNDEMLGSAFSDTLIGNQGDDTLDGNRGNDLIYGGTGSDVLQGGIHNDFITGGARNDRLFGGANDDVLLGDAGNDTVQGGSGNDLIFGGNGANNLSGGEGNDTIFSTGETDNLTGGGGSDVFSVSTTGNSIINDWSYESGDMLSFQGQYESVEDVRNRMISVQYEDGRPGDLMIEHEGGTTTIIRGAAGQQDAVLERLFDHQTIGQNTLAQVDLFNSLTPAQVRAVMEALGTDEYNAYQASIDNTLLAQNLDGSRLANYLNGLDGVEAQQFLREIPSEARNELLLEMSAGEVNEFLGELQYEQTVSLLNNIQSSTMDEISSLLTARTQSSLTETVNRFLSDSGAADESAENSATDDLTWLGPDQQPEEPPPDEDDETNENEPRPVDSAIGSSCFIATVVYASHDHPDVWLLRWFRDEVLRRTLFGRALIALYWRFGPKLAKSVSRNMSLNWLFFILIRAMVLVICHSYGRIPGRQLDHQNHPDSRLISVSAQAFSVARLRETLFRLS